MKINWKVRLKNKAFWLALVPALLLAAQSLAACFGAQWQPDTALEQALCGLVQAVFGVLGVLGVVNDPTTQGFADSARALTYTEPN